MLSLLDCRHRVITDIYSHLTVFLTLSHIDFLGLNMLVARLFSAYLFLSIVLADVFPWHDSDGYQNREMGNYPTQLLS